MNKCKCNLYRFSRFYLYVIMLLPLTIGYFRVIATVIKGHTNKKTLDLWFPNEQLCLCTTVAGRYDTGVKQGVVSAQPLGKQMQCSRNTAMHLNHTQW